MKHITIGWNENYDQIEISQIPHKLLEKKTCWKEWKDR